MIHINLLDINASWVLGVSWVLGISWVLGVLRGIQIGEVTLFISECLLLAFFGSNIVAKGFIFIAKR